jgi:hypothetical protein
MTTAEQPKAARVTDAEAAWLGVCARVDGETLAPGLLSHGQNLRFVDQKPGTRLGVVKPVWCNLVDRDDSVVRPWAHPCGAGVFKDPNGRQWVYVACGAGVYRCVENNLARPVALPAGVQLTGPCVFVQAFNKLYLFRGRHLKPLVMGDADTGFEDVVVVWDATTDFALGDRVCWGPTIAADTNGLTSAGNVATFVSASDHGLSTGQDVLIAGATETEYNGRYTVTVLDPTSFTYEFGGSATTPATGTPTVNTLAKFWEAKGNPTAGDVPGVDADWLQIYDVLPNAETARYANNRLLVATAWTPGESTFDSSSSYTKADFLVATDIQDEVRFSFCNAFRINQGSDDEIQDIVKWSEDSVLVFKDRSWGVVNGLATSLTGLSGVSLDMREQGYGLLCRGAAAVAGKDVYFLAGSRGIVSVRQSETNKVQSVDVPLSYDIEPWLKLVDWNVARQTARLAYWNNRLYAALPLFSGEVVGPNLASGLYFWIPRGFQGDFEGPVLEVSGLEIGKRYRWTPGNSQRLTTERTEVDLGYLDLVSYDPAGEDVATGDFTATQETYYLWGDGVSWGLPSTAQVQAVGVPGQNNCMFVYDFLTQRWSGMDVGTAICVQEFFLASKAGVERLFYLGADGYVNLVEESERGDEVGDETRTAGLGWQEIATVTRSRRYFADGAVRLRSVSGLVRVATAYARYWVRLIFDGVNKERTVVSGRTPSATGYVDPWDAPDWDPTNGNDDHGTAGREDYGVILGDELNLGSGIALDLVQERPEGFYGSADQAQWVSVEVTNTRGRLQVKGVQISGARGRERKGTE